MLVLNGGNFIGYKTVVYGASNIPDNTMKDINGDWNSSALT